MKFSASRAQERRYARWLRGVAREVGRIVAAYHRGDGTFLEGMDDALEKYSDLLGSVAPIIAQRFIINASKRNEMAWRKNSNVVAQGLIDLLNSGEGSVILDLIHEEVTLIKSLPLEAGKRAQALAMEAAISGSRGEEVVAQIMATEQVTESRATLIARTEIAKANAVINQVRAQNVGVTHYVWQTAADEIVRKSHRHMQGRTFSFSDPPLVEGEGHHGPGMVYNCRCWAEPILPDA